jgi:hypothetical protein
MRITIIPEDHFVRCDDKTAFLSDWPFEDSSIHAIQWYGTWGEIEHKASPPYNERIEDESVVAPYVLALERAETIEDSMST